MTHALARSAKPGMMRLVPQLPPMGMGMALQAGCMAGLKGLMYYIWGASLHRA